MRGFAGGRGVLVVRVPYSTCLVEQHRTIASSACAPRAGGSWGRASWERGNALPPCHPVQPRTHPPASHTSPCRPSRRCRRFLSPSRAWACTLGCALGVGSFWDSQGLPKHLAPPPPPRNNPRPPPPPLCGLALPPLCDIPSGCCSFTGPWTVTRSSLRMLRWVAAF